MRRNRISLRNTIYKDFMSVLVEKYNNDAKKVYENIENTLEEILRGSELPKGKRKIKYLRRAILPTIAIYRVCDDIDLLDKFLISRYSKIAKRYQLYGRLPSFFAIMRFMVKKLMKISDEYEHEWVKDSRNEIAFNITSCYYKDTFKDYGCPFLCLLFCRNDEIVYGKMSRKVELIRNGTLARGNDCCDMMFRRKT